MCLIGEDRQGSPLSKVRIPCWEEKSHWCELGSVHRALQGAARVHVDSPCYHMLWSDGAQPDCNWDKQKNFRCVKLNRAHPADCFCLVLAAPTPRYLGRSNWAANEILSRKDHWATRSGGGAAGWERLNLFRIPSARDETFNPFFSPKRELSRP